MKIITNYKHSTGRLANGLCKGLLLTFLSLEIGL